MSGSEFYELLVGLEKFRVFWETHSRPDMSSLLALSNIIKTFLESKKNQTVKLDEQRERPTKSGVLVDKILQ